MGGDDGRLGLVLRVEAAATGVGVTSVTAPAGSPPAIGGEDFATVSAGTGVGRVCVLQPGLAKISITAIT